jgi:predicted DNA binding protein
MLDILRATSSREGAARAFCDHLVESRGYACAWVGTRDQSGGVVPQAAAGREAYLDDALAPGTTPADGAEPALLALAEEEPQVVAPVDGAEGWQAVASEYGLQSVVAVPLDHEGTVFGVLAAYGTTPGVSDDERELLAEYGETVGYALRAAGWKESLLSATPVTVTVELTDQTVPLVAVAHRLPAAVDLQVLTTALAEDRLLYVLRVAGATPAELRAEASTVDAVERVDISREGETVRCELAVSLPTPETILADRGARVTDVTVEDGRLSLTVVQQESGPVEALVEAVQSEYPDASVRSVRASGDTADGSVRNPLGALTDRQRQAVELAFYSGYFQRPREHNTTEVADKLDVSRQTFTQHLRAGQRKLLSVLLDQ